MTENRKNRGSGWVIFGFVLTISYVAALVMVLLRGSQGGFIYIQDDLNINNFVDILAGAFAPLAFLWLFVATMVQSQELALQRRELKQNRVVAKEQANESRRAAEFIGVQTQILRDQLEQRRAEFTAESFDARAGSLLVWTRSVFSQPVRYLNKEGQVVVNLPPLGGDELSTDSEVGLMQLCNRLLVDRDALEEISSRYPGGLRIDEPHIVAELVLRLVKISNAIESSDRYKRLDGRLIHAIKFLHSVNHYTSLERLPPEIQGA